MNINPLESHVKAILGHFPTAATRSAEGCVMHTRTTAGGSGSGAPGRLAAGWGTLPLCQSPVGREAAGGAQPCALCSQRHDAGGPNYTHGTFLVTFKPSWCSEDRGRPSLTGASYSTLWVPFSPGSLAAEGAQPPERLPSGASDARHTQQPASRASLRIRQGNVQGTHSRAPNTCRGHKQQRTLQRSQSSHGWSVGSFSL